MLQDYLAGTNEEVYYSPNVVIDRSNAEEYLED